MSFAYTPAKTKIAKGEIDFREGGDDIRVILVMANTTADTEKDVEFVGGLTTLDEYNGANYVRKALANQVVNQDNENDRAEIDADDTSWSLLGVGTRQCVGAVIYKHVGADDAANPLLFYIVPPECPFDGNGGTVTLQWNAEGIGQVT